MERNRYPRRGQTCPLPMRSAPTGHPEVDNCLCVNQPIALGMSYVKSQPFGQLYSPCEGWRRGTIFPDLDKPFRAGGMRK